MRSRLNGIKSHYQDGLCNVTIETEWRQFKLSVANPQTTPRGVNSSQKDYTCQEFYSELAKTVEDECKYQRIIQPLHYYDIIAAFLVN